MAIWKLLWAVGRGGTCGTTMARTTPAGRSIQARTIRRPSPTSMTTVTWRSSTPQRARGSTSGTTTARRCRGGPMSHRSWWGLPRWRILTATGRWRSPPEPMRDRWGPIRSRFTFGRLTAPWFPGFRSPPPAWSRPRLRWEMSTPTTKWRLSPAPTTPPITTTCMSGTHRVTSRPAGPCGPRTSGCRRPRWAISTATEIWRSSLAGCIPPTSSKNCLRSTTTEVL